HNQQVFIGELGLDGSVRAVRGIIGKVLLGRARGITTFYIPADNLDQAQLIPQVDLIPVSSLEQLYNHFCLDQPILSVNTGRGRYSSRQLPTSSSLHLSEVVGQERAKRALEI